jgi:transcriptional regulator with PAS, ATPase and Fis domain
MKKTLFAWIGENDLRSAQVDGANGMGAICQAALNRKFDEIVLLSDYPKDRTAPYVKWLGSNGAKSVKLIQVDLGGNPTDYRAIYENAKLHVQNYLDASATKPQLTFHLSSGTSQMATIWAILANSRFNAKLLQSSKEQGVQDIEFPFDIAADYLPELLRKNEKKIASLFADDSTPAGFKEIIHQGSAMKNLINRAKVISPYPVPVLIQGESGTGKELLAKAIHSTSMRKGKFVAINCGAIPSELFESELFGHKKGAFTGADRDKAGYIEEAVGGTLFLDEIGEMPLKIQVKLLRVLQENRFSRVGESSERDTDIRIISATNRNLIDEIGCGSFREDLFHRLAVAILYVPPLREREGDLGLLIDYLLISINKKLGENRDFKSRKMSVAAKSLLMSHV